MASEQHKENNPHRPYCWRCKGTGIDPKTDETCPRCDGSGWEPTQEKAKQS